MNKLLIVLLAICLISCAHAFVKREATDDDAAKLNIVMKQIEELSKKYGDALTKSIGEGIEKIKTGLESLKENSAGAPKN